jgi:hypothetical protein
MKVSQNRSRHKILGLIYQLFCKIVVLNNHISGSIELIS